MGPLFYVSGGLKSAGRSICGRQGLRSRSGVPSRQSMASISMRPAAWSRLRILTVARAIGLGRAGERNEKTPVGCGRRCGFWMTRPRGASPIQQRTMMWSPWLKPVSPRRQVGASCNFAGMPRSRASAMLRGHSGRDFHCVWMRPMKMTPASAGVVAGSISARTSPGRGWSLVMVGVASCVAKRVHQVAERLWLWPSRISITCGGAGSEVRRSCGLISSRACRRGSGRARFRLRSR